MQNSNGPRLHIDHPEGKIHVKSRSSHPQNNCLPLELDFRGPQTRPLSKAENTLNTSRNDMNVFGIYLGGPVVGTRTLAHLEAAASLCHHQQRTLFMSALMATLSGEKMMPRETNSQNDDGTLAKKFLGASLVLEVTGRSGAKVVWGFESKLTWVFAWFEDVIPTGLPRHVVTFAGRFTRWGKVGMGGYRVKARRCFPFRAGGDSTLVATLRPCRIWLVKVELKSDLKTLTRHF